MRQFCLPLRSGGYILFGAWLVADEDNVMKLARIAAFLFCLCPLAFSFDTDLDQSLLVTPEPSMLAFLGTALAGIGVVAWRRNRKR